MEQDRQQGNTGAGFVRLGSVNHVNPNKNFFVKNEIISSRYLKKLDVFNCIQLYRRMICFKHD